MADNLSKPSDFRNVALLPPSSFEKSSHDVVDPWDSLARATGEILHLRLENEKLRNVKVISVPAGEEIRARVDLHHSKPTTPIPPPPQPPVYLDSIINRQAAEIETLSQKLHSRETEYQQRVAQLEHQVALQDLHLNQKVQSLEAELSLVKNHERELSHTYKQKESEMMQQHEEVKTHFQKQIEAAQRDHMLQFEELRRRNQQEVDDLKSRYEKSLLDSEQEVAALKKKLSMLELELDSERKAASQLKTYLKDNCEVTKSTESWRKQVQTLENRIQILEEEKSRFNSTLELLTIRLKSQQQVISLHEQHVSENGIFNKNCVPAVDAKPCILTRWREKVYELLVKQQCSELVYRDEVNKWNDKLWKLEEEVKASDNDRQRLELSLKDKQAELDLEIGHSKDLERDLFHAQQVALDLDEQHQHHLKIILQLVEVAQSTEEKYSDLCTLLDKFQGQLQLYNQRMNFASGRLAMLKGQFARKEARLRLRKSDWQPDQVDIHEPPERDRDVVNQLQLELERVTHERDALNKQIQDDADLLQEKIIAIKQETVGELEDLRQKLMLLHGRMDESTEKNQELCQQLERLLKENEELKETNEEFKSSLARCQMQANQERELAAAELHEEHRKQIMDLEQKLNQARREQAKALVSLRQQERQIEREKLRMNAKYKSLEAEYQKQIAALHQTVHALDQERNLLMTTIRQEGLLSKLKANRPAPQVDSIELLRATSEPSLTQGDSIFEDKPLEYSSDAKLQSAELMHVLDQETDEPLHCIIDDIKHLAAAVDEDILSEEDQEGEELDAVDHQSSGEATVPAQS